MKREYDSPEWELLSFKLNDVVMASGDDYPHEPEYPDRDGDDSGSGELFPNS